MKLGSGSASGYERRVNSQRSPVAALCQANRNCDAPPPVYGNDLPEASETYLFLPGYCRERSNFEVYVISTR